MLASVCGAKPISSLRSWGWVLAARLPSALGDVICQTVHQPYTRESPRYFRAREPVRLLRLMTRNSQLQSSSNHSVPHVSQSGPLLPVPSHGTHGLLRHQLSEMLSLLIHTAASVVLFQWRRRWHIGWHRPFAASELVPCQKKEVTKPEHELNVPFYFYLRVELRIFFFVLIFWLVSSAGVCIWWNVHCLGHIATMYMMLYCAEI